MLFDNGSDLHESSSCCCSWNIFVTILCVDLAAPGPGTPGATQPTHLLVPAVNFAMDFIDSDTGLLCWWRCCCCCCCCWCFTAVPIVPDAGPLPATTYGETEGDEVADIMGVGRGATPADAEEDDADAEEEDEIALELDPEGVGGTVSGLSGVPP